uniref:Protein krueppel n=1 Tax=Dendroctonus ponderosae TaxID=77166 RepID=A0AAR5PRS2_DENPD
MAVTSSRVFETFDEQNAPHLCRACLGMFPHMKPLLDGSEQSNTLLGKLLQILDIEVRDFMPKYARSLCKVCEDKVEMIAAFTEQCRQAAAVIEQFSVNSEVRSLQQGSADSDCPERRKLSTNEAAGCKQGFNGEREPAASGPERENAKTHTAVQRYKLKQYSFEDVARAIRVARLQLYKQVDCALCRFVAVSSRSLSTHITRVHPEVKGKWCSKCNQPFEDLQEHIFEAHREDLKCPFCSRIQSNMGHFVEHLASHSGERLHKCPQCSKSFISLRHLQAHKMSHEKAKPSLNQRTVEPQNYCKTCEKKVRSLAHHSRKYHGANAIDPKMKLCPYCGKQVRSNKLMIHQRTHTGEAPYQCQFCDKRLKSRNILVVHERTHTGLRPYTCQVCGKSFAQSSVLNTHRKIHTGKLEQCSICCKRFCRPVELRLHLRSHTGEKPYVCQLCGQGFKQSSHLVEHKRKHSSSRPFKCDVCQKSFKNFSTLKGHLRIHTGEKPFKCSQCSYAARQAYMLTQHMRQHAHSCQQIFSTAAHLEAHRSR